MSLKQVTHVVLLVKIRKQNKIFIPLKKWKDNWLLQLAVALQPQSVSFGH